jgi:hypothetical protein
MNGINDKGRYRAGYGAEIVICHQNALLVQIQVFCAVVEQIVVCCIPGHEIAGCVWETPDSQRRGRERAGERAVAILFAGDDRLGSKTSDGQRAPETGCVYRVRRAL